VSIIEPDGRDVTRTFRLDKAWDIALGKEAEKRGSSISNLLENMVRDYINYYRWLEVFNSITFSHETFIEFVDAIDEDTLKKLGEKVGKTAPVHEFMVRGDKLTPEVAKYFITQLIGRYNNWCKVSDHESNHAYYYIRHDYGPKWNVFLSAYISSLYKNLLGMKIDSQVVANNLLIKISE
jgi:hypothetical protein